ncbi:NAD-dependent epimerase [Geobacillus sp. E263]|uniref:NAD-dependent epimerase n=1 Tax=Geobacillus sp. E263 TaxID=391290 RepID=UPI001179E9F9|nr:NAD-dependent epimerase [Geobacillus sp. E263]
MLILVTGAAGFIGMHLSKRLVKDGYSVIGIDNLNDYYDVTLKKDRVKELIKYDSFRFFELDLIDQSRLVDLFKTYKFETVINLAAQAGVRYSLVNPTAYINSNLVGFANILEACRHFNIQHLIYASSSSVYGSNTKMPFSEHDNVDHPVSLYAATKKSNELMAHTYSHLYGIPTTGLRFFTVYGPWGRPDMAYFSFTKNILEGKPIKVFNYGNMKRDFTYIDDIVEGIVRLIKRIPEANDSWDRSNPDPATSYAPYRIYNIGNNQPVKLMDFVETLEKLLGKKANIEFLPMQDGDVEATYADITDLHDAVGFKPSTSLEKGLQNFVDWYISYYGYEPRLIN